VLKKAVAVVTDHGGRTCHAAIVARELGIPCVVGAGHATTALEAGKVVTVSCADGDEGRVYEGEVAFDRIEIDPGELPEPPVPLMVNLADPDQALDVSRLPTAGVGLLRVEFIVSNWVGIHPMALAHPERITDPQVEAEVRHRTRAWSSPADFFVDRLATGVGQIAAAFYPRPVIVRFSDFKTDEYARLFGGADFELPESNPMIGFRGASRYYDERYRDGFALECAAIRRVRDTMGLTNVLVMIPFCRTVAEGKRVLEVMADNGLSRGENGLKVYVMCEIPNNVILADRFAEIFDGFSIGSNDLTQLTLGIDRNSELLMPLFDERDEGVKRMISSVIKVAHEHGRPVGICGQAPSDHPDFAEFLIEQGIDTISLTPDAVVTVARRLGGVK
ncbi:MAG: putative PEP-binding protein, partial [Planctomycetota bacterium]|jgi:pyruvate,water dikinase